VQAFSRFVEPQQVNLMIEKDANGPGKWLPGPCFCGLVTFAVVVPTVRLSDGRVGELPGLG